MFRELAPFRYLIASAMFIAPVLCSAQFVDSFDGPSLDGWFHMVGDGTPTMALEPRKGYLRYEVDASTDQHGVWWTLIKRDITEYLDIEKLSNAEYELRVEARVRASHAPRRVNFMVNTQRTTDFHEHLREYELANTTDWHTISMTTSNFDVRPGDTVYVQFCVTDWGPGQYAVDIDYYRADVVRKDQAEPDKGEPLVYHPAVPDLSTFTHHLMVPHDSVVSTQFPNVNFNDWHVQDRDGPARVLTVGATEWIVLRWDFGDLRDEKVEGAGVLELTTHSLAIGGRYAEALGQDHGEEFGKIRVIEILGGDPVWDQETVTYGSLVGSAKYEDVFNAQMIIDLELAATPGEKAYFTLPRPVIQRLIDGKAKGLLVRPLGAQAGSIYASEDSANRGPRLHFSTTSRSH